MFSEVSSGMLRPSKTAPDHESGFANDWLRRYALSLYASEGHHPLDGLVSLY